LPVFDRSHGTVRMWCFSIEVAPQFMRDAYPQRIRAHIDELKKAAAGIGADHVLVNTSDSLDQALRNYLLFRQRRK
jgi:hypothetical protein